MILFCTTRARRERCARGRKRAAPLLARIAAMDAMSDLASLRQSRKRPLASEMDSEQVDIDGQLRFKDEADDLLTHWQAPPPPPPEPRDILIKETSREIRRARFADEAPKSVADESG